MFPLRDIRRASDRGFTLVELLLTVTIMGLITLPLANLVLGYFDTTTQTTARMSESHDEQLASGTFAQDVASLGRRDLNDPAQPLLTSLWTASSAGAPYVCGSTTPVVLFAWDQFTSSAGSISSSVVEVAYVTQAMGSETQLRRVYCAGSSGSATTTVVAHNLIASQAPQITCSPSCTVPAVVKMKLSVRDPSQPTSVAPTVITLTGQRRQT